MDSTIEEEKQAEVDSEEEDMESDWTCFGEWRDWLREYQQIQCDDDIPSELSEKLANLLLRFVQGSYHDLLKEAYEKVALARTATITSSRETALHLAVKRDDFLAVRLMLEYVGPEGLKIQDENGETALHCAIGKKMTIVCKPMLNISPELVNIRNNNRDTPLILAAQYGVVRMFDILDPFDKLDPLEDVCIDMIKNYNMENSLIFAKNSYSNTALHLAVKSRLENLCCLLIHRASAKDLRLDDENGDTALNLAICKRMQKLCTLMLEKSPELVNTLNRNRDTPLILAAYNDMEGLCVHMMERLEYRHMFVQNSDLDTAFHLAVSKGMTELCRLLIERALTDDLLVKDRSGNTVLHLALHNRNFEMAYQMLKRRSPSIPQLGDLDRLINDSSDIGKMVMASENDYVDAQVLESNDAHTKTLSTYSGDCSLAISVSAIGKTVMASENDDVDRQVLGFNDAPTSDNTKTLSTGSEDCSPVSVIRKTVMASENDDIDVQVLRSNDAPTSDNSKTLSTGSRDCSLAIGGKQKRQCPPLKSDVWEHFDRDHDTMGDNLTAVCKYCHKRFNAPSKNGTSNLKRHLKRCTHSVKEESKKVLAFDNVKKDGDEGVGAAFLHYNFKMEVVRRELAIMIVMLELQLSIVDRAPFWRFVKSINPRFQFISRNTVEKECSKIYCLEKGKLKAFLSTSSKHISLTADLWTSNQNLEYLSLTAHFIDINWKLHKKILSFCMVPTLDNGVVFAEMIERCLVEYDIKKICTITLDDATNNKTAVENLEDTLSRKGMLLQRKFFHVECAADVTNLIVQNSLNEIKSLVEAIRTCVKYVQSSQSRKKEFDSCVQQESISSSTKGLSLDVCTRWDSTYLMLESAIPYKRAFSLLKTRDSIYAKEVTPTFDDWRKVEIICKLLSAFYDARKVFSGTEYATSNNYFHGMFNIEAHLLEMKKNDDGCISSMAEKMQEKFNKYWKKCSILYAIAVVLDPRFKLKYVAYVYDEIYSDSDAKEHIEAIRNDMVALYNEYTSFSFPLQKQAASIDDNISETMRGTSSTSSKISLRKEKYLSMSAGKKNVDFNTELEQYLDEEICGNNDSNFDILNWWKVNGIKFPVLSMMARDILAFQSSTVASESAFSIGSKVINQYQSSLSPDVVQALICTQDWLRDAITDDVVAEEAEAYDHENDNDVVEYGVTEVEEIV